MSTITCNSVTEYYYNRCVVHRWFEIKIPREKKKKKKKKDVTLLRKQKFIHTI